MCFTSFVRESAGSGGRIVSLALFLILVGVIFSSPALAATMRLDGGSPPGLQVNKQIRLRTTNWMNANDPASAPVAEAPSAAYYRIWVTNTASSDMIDVTVSDPMLGLEGPTSINIGNLKPGETFVLQPPGLVDPVGLVRMQTIAALYAQQACEAEGTVINLATVQAVEKATGQTQTVSDPAVLVCEGAEVEGVEIRKQIRVAGQNWKDADDVATAQVAEFPSDAEYRMRVENVGSNYLLDVTITDPMLGLEDATAVNMGGLGVGDVIYLLPPEEPNPEDATELPVYRLELLVSIACDEVEDVTNIASVTALVKDGNVPVSDDDPAVLSCEAPSVPDIEIVKQIRVDGGPWMDADDVVSAPQATAPSTADYRIRVKNTGDTFLLDVTVTDPMLGLEGPAEVYVGGLGVGEVIYLLPPEELNPGDATEEPIYLLELFAGQTCDEEGEFTNVATVTGDDKSSQQTVIDSDAAILVCEGADVCLLVIDEEGLDNDFRSVEDAADAISDFNGKPGFVEPDELINDNRPTESGNPPLLWNELVAAGLTGDVDGRMVLLPTGQVDDEGWYALPPGPDILYKDGSRPPNCGLAGGYDEWVARFAAGTLSQNCLDEVLDVMPLRNQDLAPLVGQTCVAVVYDSDISMNYEPIFGNLQGGRLGRFTFTVLALEVPGSLPESGSDTSLYDLWLYVEEPAESGVPYSVTVRDHEPDSVEIVRANYAKGVLTVIGESDRAPGASMTVTVDGADDGSDPLEDPFLLEFPMNHVGGDRYRVDFPTGTNLDGRRVIIQTDEGGAYNDSIR